MDWTSHAGHAVSGTTEPAFENPAEPMWVDEDDVMAVTAQSSGQTLRQLAGAGQHGTPRVSSDPRRAAAMAASARLSSAANGPSSSRSPSPGATSASADMSLQKADSVSRSAAAAAAGAEVAINPDADIASMGHRDPSTEQAEDAMRALGSMAFGRQAAALQSHHSATSSLTPELSIKQQPGNQFLSHLPDQQIDDKTQTAASSDEPKEGSSSDIRHASGSGKKRAESQHQATLPQTQRAQHAQQEEVVHQAAVLVHHMSQAKGADQGLRSSSQMHTAVDQGFAGQQHNPFNQQTAAGQQAAAQQDDNVMDADPDDPAVQRYRQAEAAIVQLKSEAGASGQQSALATLLKILQVWMQSVCPQVA